MTHYKEETARSLMAQMHAVFDNPLFGRPMVHSFKGREIGYEHVGYGCGRFRLGYVHVSYGATEDIEDIARLITSISQKMFVCNVESDSPSDRGAPRPAGILVCRRMII